MRSSKHLLAALLAVSAAMGRASPLSARAQEHQRPLMRRQTAPPALPSSWVQHSPADPSDGVKFTLALKGQNMDELAGKMHEIAARDDGQWLSDEQLRHYTQPSPKDKQALEAYLAQHGIPPQDASWSKHGDHVTVTTTAGTASKMFHQPNLYRFNHTATGRVYVKAHSLHIAPHLSFIEHVTNLTSFPHVKTPNIQFKPISPATAKKLADSGCDGNGVTGTCLRSLYGVDEYTPSGKGPKTAVLLMGYNQQYASNSDLASYLQQFGPSEAQGGRVKILNGGGGYNDENQPGDEADLDIEMATVMNYPLQNAYLYYEEHGSFLDESLQYVLDQGIKPGVISISYGASEAQIGQSQAKHTCSIVQKLAAQGTTVMVASGDDGVQGVQYSGESCDNGFDPTFPSGCPYVLSVGATKNPSHGSETATTWGGGGFSNFFNVPDYQSSAVKSYLGKIGNKNQGKFNKDGRAYPDVAAIGQTLLVVTNGQQGTLIGTSASCPIFAGLLSLANDARSAAGKGTIGFVHPALYKGQSSFNDITSGQNAGCDGNPVQQRRNLPARRQYDDSGNGGYGASGLGFPAVEGYDAVTGLGSIQTQKLVSLVSGAASTNPQGSSAGNSSGAGSN